ncbi:SufS family cysteine desulfurase [Stieleria marina]|uniref:cysteine desulfurase n=1 Tax=Stieleria marina TaxID=1930275 RepID=A0A517NWP3_9BACT|nr:putative cysteine desulfurase [Planctomycetes bacterium K23_9]
MSVVEDLIEEFAELDEREANQLLDELGRELPKLDDALYSKENLVAGCQSRVWIVQSFDENAPHPLQIQADSDAIVVKGLVYLLLQIYRGKTADEILAVDYVEIFDRLQLSRLITPQRKNGLFSMVNTIRDHAAKQLGQTSAPVISPTVDLDAGRPAIRLSIDGVASHFPILNRPLPNGKRTIFLDSGASAQKPKVVIDKEREVQEEYYANAFRGRYYFGQRIDDAIESTRQATANLVGAGRPDEIVFTAGTTMSINMVASAYGDKNVRPGDEIVITELEHHANFVPWQALAKRRGAKLRILPITNDGLLSNEAIESTINEKTAIVAVTSMSNVLGTLPPIEKITHLAHQCGAVVLVDAAQSIPHQRIDVVKSEIDFLTFSGHKLYGPTGVGVLYGRYDLLTEMDPFMYGGHMISQVGREESNWALPPAKFEAGTMPIVQIVSLGAAIEFVNAVGLDVIGKHEHSLLQLAHQRLTEIDGLTIYGPQPDNKGSIVSFSIQGVSSEDLAIRLDEAGIFTRHGHHCAMVLHERLGVPATTRASIGMYNTTEDIDELARTVKSAVKQLRV